MWKKLLAYFTHLLTLAEATRQNRAEIKEIRQELRDLTISLAGVIHELRTLRSDQRHETENWPYVSKMNCCGLNGVCLR